MRQYRIQNVVPQTSKIKKKRFDTFEFKDFECKTLSHSNICHTKYFMKLRNKNHMDTQNLHC